MRIETQVSQGLYQAQDLRSRSATTFAQSERANNEQALLDLRRSELQAQTSTKVIKGSDDMVGTMIDIVV